MYENMNKTEKKGSISIVIPTYHRLTYLQIAIESCLSQSLLPVKIIIGDDSNDNLTEEWVKNFKTDTEVLIEYIHNRPSLKQGANVDMLIERVDTECLLLLHDDDCLLPNALTDLYKVFEQNPSTDIAFGKQYIMDKNGNVKIRQSEQLNAYFSRTEDSQGAIANGLSVLFKQQLPSNSFLIKSALAQRIRYGEKEKAGNGVDFHFCYKLALDNAQFHYIDTFVSCYRDSPDGISKTTNSGYHAFNLLSRIEIGDNKDINDLKNSALQKKAPIAIMQANKMKLKKEAWRIFFSSHHRAKIFSLGGLNRFATLIFK